jgi:hypothetical protein
MRKRQGDDLWQDFLAIPAFLFSVFLHVLVIQCIGVTFSSRHSQPSSHVVFLGAILETFDVSHLSTQYRLADTQDKSLITIKDRTTAFSPTKVTAVAKPHFSQNSAENSRLFLKSLFDKTKEEESIRDVTVNIPWEQYDISPTPFPYVPLKLKLQ